MADFKVKLLSSGQAFEVRPHEMILDAAIRQGIEIVYTCRNGTCRTCISEVVEGSVVQEEPELCLISEKELAMNKRLLCMSTLSSDAVIEPKVRPKIFNRDSADFI